MVNNDWVIQRLSDICNCTIQRPAIVETTALGAAFLAGLQCGVYDSLDQLAERWSADQAASPAIDTETRARLLNGWKRAVNATRSFSAQTE